MSNTRQHRKKILRTSWKAKGCLSLILLGVVALFCWRVSMIGDTFLVFILGSSLIAFFGWLLKQHLETKIMLADEELIYQKGRKRKTVKYENISEIRFCRVGAFDAAGSQWMFLSMLHRMENRDEDSFNSFSQWLGVKEPEKTVTLDLSLFDVNAVSNLRIALAELSPQAKHDLK